jgi:hypothetical protein
VVDITVALPIFKGKNIFWLSMESLCRQKDVNFSWELVVAEEQIKPFAGEDNIRKYSQRLSDIGCKEIKYIPLQEWMPLSQKWALIAKYSNSKFFVCQADDNYSHPYRLKEAHENIDYDYICYPKCLFYFISNHKAYEHTILPFRTSDKPAKGLHYAFKTEYAKKMPKSDKKIIIDQWIYDFLRKHLKNNIKHKWVLSDHWKEGFNTHGFHRLSKTRYSKFKNKVVDAEMYSKKWPEDILQKLKKIKGISEL